MSSQYNKKNLTSQGLTLVIHLMILDKSVLQLTLIILMGILKLFLHSICKETKSVTKMNKALKYSMIQFIQGRNMRPIELEVL